MGKQATILDEGQKRQICRLVAGLIASDEDFDAVERAFLERLLEGFGLAKSEWDSIFPLVDPEAAADAMRVLPIDAQEAAFDLLLQAAAADGKVAEQELTFLFTVASELQIEDAEVERRLAAL